jgi:hypothetical protein
LLGIYAAHALEKNPAFYFYFFNEFATIMSKIMFNVSFFHRLSLQSFLSYQAEKNSFMRAGELAVKGKFGFTLSVEILAKTKKLALRRGVWFKALNRIERAIIDLTLQCVDSIKSAKLAKLVTAITDKLQSAMESIIDRLVRTIGVPLAKKISCIAVGWGNISAKNWAADLSFAAFLALAQTNK